MKKILLTVALTSAALMMSAQSKINPRGTVLLQEYREALVREQLKPAGTDAKTEVEDPIMGAIVILAPGATAECVTSLKDVTLMSDLGDIITVDAPLSMMEVIAEQECVKSLSFGDRQEPLMDKARPACNVDQVQDGFTYKNNTYSFDGTGVIVSMFDTGLEANHINFQHDDGTSRISQLYWYKANSGNPTTYTSTSVKNFTTDNSGQTHATHVAGIMGGSYKGACSQGAGGASTVPYWGVAPGGDLVLGVGPLSNTNIINAVTKIAEYAQSVGKPAVINLSLGSTNGPHDGTDATCQALARVGQKAIVCVAAGNDGDKPIAIEYTRFSTRDMQTLLVDNKMAAGGNIDVWSKDNSTFTVTMAIYSSATRKITAELGQIRGSGQQVSVSNTNNATFGASFTGSFVMSSGIDANNNRFWTTIYSSAGVNPKSATQTDFLCLVVKGSNGQQVYVYGSSGAQFTNKAKSSTVTGFVNGSTDGSINNMCTGDYTVSVGSFNTRMSWPSINGGSYSYQVPEPIGNISDFSSYGPTFQGDQLPVITAPGMGVESSYSRYYINAAGGASTLAASLSAKAKDDYWGNMQGTSMACPFVTGTIALWLQAEPTLTFDDIMEVIEHTSVVDNAVDNEPERFGYGKIDALEGIKYILDNKAAIGSVFADDAQRMMVTTTAGGYEVYVPGEQQFGVRLYSVSGGVVAMTNGVDGRAQVSTDGLAHGVYVIEAIGATGRYTAKVMK